MLYAVASKQSSERYSPSKERLLLILVAADLWNGMTSRTGQVKCAFSPTQGSPVQAYCCRELMGFA